MQRRVLTAVAVASVITGLACASGGVRPSYKPFPQDVVDTIKASPSAIIQEVAARAISENLQVQWSSPAEGYFESQVYDVVTRRSGNVDNSNRDNFITVRFWADSIGGGKSQVTGEATIFRTSDPSVMGRDREAAVRPGHPGDVLVHRILQGLHERFGS